MTMYLGVLMLIVVTVLSCVIVGPAALAGIGVMLLLVPLQLAVARSVGKQRKAAMSKTNTRVSVMNEILIAIKLVKMYNWEQPFADSIGLLRGAERNTLQKAAYMQSGVQALMFVVPTLAAVVTFIVHVAVGGELLPEDAFATVGLFNVLFMPLSVFPQAVRSVSEARIGMKRLHQLVLGTNVDRNNINSGSESRGSNRNGSDGGGGGGGGGGSTSIEIVNGSFEWPAMESSPAAGGDEDNTAPGHKGNGSAATAVAETTATSSILEGDGDEKARPGYLHGKRVCL